MRVAAPPVQVGPPQPPRAIKNGDFHVRGELGTANDSVVVTPSVIFGQLAGSYAVADEFSVGLGGYLLHVQGDVDPGETSNKSIWGGRLGLRYAPLEQANFELGFGGGTSAGGEVLGGDLGFSAGYVNRVATPFFAASAGVSVPVRRRWVRYVNTEGFLSSEDSEPTTATVRMGSSGSIQLAAGVEFLSKETVRVTLELMVSHLFPLSAADIVGDAVEEESTFVGLKLGFSVSGSVHGPPNAD